MSTVYAGALNSLDEFLRLEWLDCSQKGGWSGSTISGAHSRSYHGILVAATNPPTERQVMLSRLDETVWIENKEVELATRRYQDCCQPDGHRYIQSFTFSPYPIWIYKIESLVIKKELVSSLGKNEVVLRYSILEGPDEAKLHLRPFIAARDYHSLTNANDFIAKEMKSSPGVWSIEPYPGLPPITFILEGKYTAAPDWYRSFVYREEQDRGLGSKEDLFTPGVFEALIKKDAPFCLAVTCENYEMISAAALFREEEHNRKATHQGNYSHHPLAYLLSDAADSFLVPRHNGKSLLAGYHWFTDWGRDSMIAMRGLLLARGKFAAAKDILSTYAKHLSEGMIPNVFPDNNASPMYNTVDASLWFTVAAYEYDIGSDDPAFSKDTLLPTISEIIERYSAGTRYKIKQAEDGLINAGDRETQLTWMDAKVGNWAVTPRYGKAVEINALWYTALKTKIHFEKKYGKRGQITELQRQAATVKTAFLKTFWNEERQCLYDVVNEQGADASIRPNQIFAAGLPFPVLDRKQAGAVVDCVRNHLLTIRGLRTLAPGELGYRGQYRGAPMLRDSAYHNGTVWPWLLGGYADALFYVKGDDALEELRDVFEAFIGHMQQACMGTISGIFGGDPPHQARGAVSQAWSVGEVLRVYLKYLTA